MFVASKYEDIYPLKLSVLFEKIGHRKIEKFKLLSHERKIVQTLDFNLRLPTLYDFLSYFEDATKPFIKQRYLSYDLYETMNLYVSKVVCHEYKLI